MNLKLYLREIHCIRNRDYWATMIVVALAALALGLAIGSEFRPQAPVEASGGRIEFGDWVRR